MLFGLILIGMVYADKSYYLKVTDSVSANCAEKDVRASVDRDINDPEFRNLADYPYYYCDKTSVSIAKRRIELVMFYCLPYLNHSEHLMCLLSNAFLFVSAGRAAGIYDPRHNFPINSLEFCRNVKFYNATYSHMNCTWKKDDKAFVSGSCKKKWAVNGSFSNGSVNVYLSLESGSHSLNCEILPSTELYTLNRVTRPHERLMCKTYEYDTPHDCTKSPNDVENAYEVYSYTVVENMKINISDVMSSLFLRRHQGTGQVWFVDRRQHMDHYTINVGMNYTRESGQDSSCWCKRYVLASEVMPNTGGSSIHMYALACTHVKQSNCRLSRREDLHYILNVTLNKVDGVSSVCIHGKCVSRSDMFNSDSQQLIGISAFNIIWPLISPAKTASRFKHIPPIHIDETIDVYVHRLGYYLLPQKLNGHVYKNASAHAVYQYSVPLQSVSSTVMTLRLALLLILSTLLFIVLLLCRVCL